MSDTLVPHIQVMHLTDKREERVVFYFFPLAKKYSLKVIIPFQVVPVSAESVSCLISKRECRNSVHQLGKSEVNKFSCCATKTEVAVLLQD